MRRVWRRTAAGLGLATIVTLSSHGAAGFAAETDVVAPAVVATPAGVATATDVATPDDGAAGAQPGSSAAEARAAVRREAEDLETFSTGTWRLRLSWPLQVAGAAGVLVGHRPASWECVTICEFRGFHAQVEVGTGGAQFAAGWASLVGETDRSSRWISNTYSGYAVRGALMRTGGLSTLSPAAQTFAGIEGTVAATRVSLSIAVYHRISSTASTDPWLIGAGLGWGF